MGGFGSGGHNKKNNELFSYYKLTVFRQLEYNHLGNGTDNIYKQKCNYGGYRYYIICPKCKNKRKYLLKTKNFLSNYNFVCRKCEGISYISQRMNLTRKIEFKLEEIENKLKKLRKKPKYMHKKTYNKLKKELKKAELKYINIYFKIDDKNFLKILK